MRPPRHGHKPMDEKRVDARVPTDTHRKMQILAASRGESLHDFVTRLVDEAWALHIETMQAPPENP